VTDPETFAADLVLRVRAGRAAPAEFELVAETIIEELLADDEDGSIARRLWAMVDEPRAN
jgi:hypothetical protein